MQQAYSYSAAPHAAPVKTKPKYRDEQEENDKLAQNLMYDSRIVRGNTYSAKVLSGQTKQQLDSAATANRSKIPGKSRTTMSSSSRRVGTPPPLEGRSHMVMQTDEFFEELTDRPMEQDADTQTQPFMDRPASPLFVRTKIGYDISTQIEEGDLFDFDLEVQPILEVLVGKTLHVAMLELQQEDELDAIRAQQEEYEMIRNVELSEVQRLEAELKRKAQEKERRIAQEKKRLEDRKKLEESIAARQFSAQFLGELHVAVFDALEQQGEFYDPVRREIEDMISGPLTSSVVNFANAYDVAAQLALGLLENAKIAAKKFEKEAISRREELKERIRQEEEERKRKEEEARLAEMAAKKAAEEAENNPEENS
jgi:murein DD-endopeptidase MepM/ murein hydrolase activator NlpD